MWESRTVQNKDPPHPPVNLSLRLTLIFAVNSWKGRACIKREHGNFTIKNAIRVRYDTKLPLLRESHNNNNSNNNNNNKQHIRYRKRMKKLFMVKKENREKEKRPYHKKISKENDCKSEYIYGKLYWWILPLPFPSLDAPERKLIWRKLDQHRLTNWPNGNLQGHGTARAEEEHTGGKGKMERESWGKEGNVVKGLNSTEGIGGHTHRHTHTHPPTHPHTHTHTPTLTHTLQ